MVIDALIECSKCKGKGVTTRSFTAPKLLGTKRPIGTRVISVTCSQCFSTGYEPTGNKYDLRCPLCEQPLTPTLEDKIAAALGVHKHECSNGTKDDTT